MSKKLIATFPLTKIYLMSKNLLTLFLNFPTAQTALVQNHLIPYNLTKMKSAFFFIKYVIAGRGMDLSFFFIKYVIAGRGMDLFSGDIDYIYYIRDELKAVSNVDEEEE